MASWQSALKDISNIMAYLFKTGTLSDVTVLTGHGSNQKSFHAHKLLLAIRSNVFERMFFGALPGKEKIEILDIKPDIFEIMLKFVYEDILAVKSIDEAIATYIASHKYHMTQLVNLCRDYIISHLNSKNVSLIYELSTVYNDRYLKSLCSKRITENPDQVIESEAFLQSSQETVKSILEIKTFDTSKQFLLFESLTKWAKAEIDRHQEDKSTQNLRQLMKPFLPKIKFLSMESDEFTRGPAASGILTDTEISKILMNMSVSNSTPLPEWYNKEEQHNIPLFDWCNKEEQNNKPILGCNKEDQHSRRESLPSKLLPLSSQSSPIKTMILHHSCSNSFRVSNISGEVLCNIQANGKDISLNGFSISVSHSSKKPEILLKINNNQKAIKIENFSRKASSPFYIHREIKLTLDEPFLMKRNRIYHIQLNLNIFSYCCKEINTSDQQGSTDDDFLVNYITNNPGKVQLHFYKVYYNTLNLFDT